MERSGERSGFVRDAFHQVAVATEHVGVVIHDVVSGPVVDGGEMGLGDGHAYAHGKTLAQRAGGHFHPVGFAELGMAGGD